MAACGDHVNVLCNFKDNLQLVLEQIRDGECKRDEKHVFNESEYWENVAIVFKVVHMEATKLSMVFSTPPPPSQKECEALISGLEKSVLALVSSYYSLPKTQGMTLRKEIQKNIQQIIERIQNLVKSITKACGSAEQLQSTGQVWEEIDRFDDLAKDNKQATLLVLQETTELVKDASQEIEQALETEGDDDVLNELLDMSDARSNENTWSEGEKNLITISLGLIKTVKSALKKTKEAVKINGNCNSETNITQLDDLADFMKKLSPIIDDMTVVLYPPVVSSSVRSKVDSLGSSLSNMLLFLKNSHLTVVSDEKWIDFLLKAKQHNVDKVLEALEEVS
ncbi:cyclin-D1-binding protein 1 homolog isoform X1 [Patella vulgata]|uniref:cyclin-D1-binding protein 1 homolog isoform X1 n=2 Tax=Patella vulgata TaxID=6465 RepID=UPI00217FD331|nr:cyclin-D1-binding protein 1 homolog isoform X1 [Patella vulgata]